MRGPVGSLLLLGTLAVACTSLLREGLPAAILDLPWTEAEADRVVMTSRGLVERGQPRPALALLEPVLAEHPRHVDARRLRQDILRERGRLGRLWHEAERALEQDADDAQALYLFGRIGPEHDQKLRCFARAAAIEPQALWPWLGLAHTLRESDPAHAIAIYERLYAATDGHPLVAIAYAALLREREDYDAAIPVYRKLQQDTRVPGVGELGLAQISLAKNDRPQAWAALLAALRQRPFDPGVQALVAGWLQSGASDDQVASVLDALREDPDRLRAFGAGDGAVVLAEVLQRMHQPLAVRSLLEGRAVSARSPSLRQLQRRLLLGFGEVAAFLALVAADVPEPIVLAEPNQLRGRWLQLLHGPWQAGDALASVDQAVALLQSLRDVGWLVEVELLAEVALHRWPDAGSRILPLRDEVRRQLAFEAGLRRLLYHGYETRSSASLATVIERLRDLSLRVLGQDVVGQPTVFSVPMIGEMLDPFTGGLAAHFDRYNRHFVLGRRAGGTAEGMLVVRLSLAELPACPDLELPGRCFEVVGMDRDVRALAGVLGGDLAGVALLNHFLIDFDAVREWARTVADRRRVAAEDGNVILTDPLPQGAGNDPLDVSWRLCVLSPVQDTDLEAAILDTIRHHERQHLVDSFHYLPVESNLWRSLGLLLQFGLSPSAIEAEMERRAELASLAVSPHTELVLAHIADFLHDPGAASPHHRGFSELGRELTAELVALGLSPTASAPSRWHTVARDLVRQAARRLLDRLP